MVRLCRSSQYKLKILLKLMQSWYILQQNHHLPLSPPLFTASKRATKPVTSLTFTQIFSLSSIRQCFQRDSRISLPLYKTVFVKWGSYRKRSSDMTPYIITHCSSLPRIFFYPQSSFSMFCFILHLLRNNKPSESLITMNEHEQLLLAIIIYKMIVTFSYCFLLCFWTDTLKKINHNVNQKLLPIIQTGKVILSLHATNALCLHNKTVR